MTTQFSTWREAYNCAVRSLEADHKAATIFADNWHIGRQAARIAALEAENERLQEVLDYVYERTYCGADAEWHFKPGYDPQVVIDALAARAQGDDR